MVGLGSFLSELVGLSQPEASKGEAPPKPSEMMKEIEIQKSSKTEDPYEGLRFNKTRTQPNRMSRLRKMLDKYKND